jgi:cation diffusion facilitator CzcD-associated flavoprotein CzcO
MNLSYWEKTAFIHYDVIIIGGGLVGLSTGSKHKRKSKTQSGCLS